MSSKELSILSKVTVIVLSILGGLSLFAAYGAQHLKEHLLLLESQDRYVVPILVEVTGFKGTPVKTHSSDEGESEQFTSTLTYRNTNAKTGKGLEGELAFQFDDISYPTEAMAVKTAQAHYKLGQKLVAFAMKENLRRASLRKASQGSRASRLNFVSVALLCLAGFLFWGRSQFKRQTEFRDNFLRWCVLIPTLTCGLIFFWAVFTKVEHNVSLDSWVETEAVIHTSRVESYSSGRDQSRSTHYDPRVTYSFTVNEALFGGYSLGSQVDDSDPSETEAQATLQPYQIGDKVSVYFNPDDPAQNALTRQKTQGLVIVMFGIMGLFFFGMFGVILLMGYFSRKG